jgi:hypothetical protein
LHSMTAYRLQRQHRTRKAVQNRKSRHHRARRRSFASRRCPGDP